MSLLFDLNKTYTFNTLAPSILGASVKNAKLISIVDYDSVIKHNNFVDNTYANILSVLPIGTPTDPKASIYYVFKTEANTELALSQYWVDIESIQVVDFINFKVTITDASMGDMQTVRNLLLSAEISNFSIEQL